MNTFVCEHISNVLGTCFFVVELHTLRCGLKTFSGMAPFRSTPEAEALNGFAEEKKAGVDGMSVSGIDWNSSAV